MNVAGTPVMPGHVEGNGSEPKDALRSGFGGKISVMSISAVARNDS